MLCVVKMLLKQKVGGRALNSHGNLVIDHGKSWKNHLNFCGNPDLQNRCLLTKFFSENRTVLLTLGKIKHLIIPLDLTQFLKLLQSVH